eukprot:TRINITY_DN4116_c0_g1_i1.p1 TRINITY_DN4116_c0_g1~~TRINITY_DN4116_c0_g1_i1.p1  ORF type:complete len:748 (-),score=145.49 TRINITY_DN4116_c0_g1_i1:82-2325(-)
MAQPNPTPKPATVVPPYINKKGALDLATAKEKWRTIENAIHQIYQQNASTLSFQNLYTSGYQIVLHKHGDILYTGVETTIQHHVVTEREKILGQADASFLEELLSHWERHRTAVSMIRDILMYMDKNHVIPQNKQPVFDLGVRLFGEHMLKDRKVAERVKSLTLQIIQQERNGEAAPQRMLLKTLTKMMTEISKKDVYEPCLEEHFLRDSTDYYIREANEYFATSTTPDYIRNVLKRLDEERERVERCFDEATKPRIEFVIKKEMILAYKQQMIEKENSGCLCMLRDWRVEDLRLLYECLKLVDDVDPMVIVIKEHLLETGVRFVTDTENNQQPLSIVEGILELRDKYNDLLHRAFWYHETDGRKKIDPIFDLAITKAFEEIVNKNLRFPEYLSLYVDSKMRKGKTQLRDEECDVVFNKVLGLFRLIKEKDVFEKYYKNHLAKRLLGQKSVSEDSERLFITKLKTENGYQFTSKLEGMFQDMKISQDTMESYKEHQRVTDRRLPCDIVAQVLTTTYWPVSKANDINLPMEVDEAARHFRQYYLNAHSGRKLHYQYNMGTADLRFRIGGKTYEVNVSTHQMAVLMLFNFAASLTLAQIHERTNIPPQDLRRALTSLCHASPKTHPAVLVKEGVQLEDGTQFSVNEEFKSKFVKLKITQVVQKESEEEAVVTRTKVDEDRKWQLDAVIVRVMKTRKVMEHRNLVADVVRQLQGRFNPSPDDIKKRIESLIEREYMERSKDSRSKYNYLA